jgi:excisionase family DNA binding protein
MAMPQQRRRQRKAVEEQPTSQIFHAEPGEIEDVDRLMERIDHVLAAHEQAQLACEGPHGQANIPMSVLEALRAVVNAMAKGQTITLVPYGKVLTTQQAAELLHVSRPHLIKLLDRGEIPHFRTDERAGAHRRVYMEDVLRYREGRNEHRRKKLAELTQRSAEYEGTYR